MDFFSIRTYEFVSRRREGRKANCDTIAVLAIPGIQAGSLE